MRIPRAPLTIVVITVHIVAVAIWWRHTRATDLPVLELMDYRQNTFNTRQLLGDLLFVQFVNADVGAQMRSIRDIFKNRPKRRVNWLIFTNDAPKFVGQIGDLPHNVLIAEHGYRELRPEFGAAECCDGWVIFDEGGRRRGHGYYNSSDAASYLRHIAKEGDLYSVNVLLDQLGRLDEPPLNRMRERTVASTKIGIIVMLSSVCTSCPSGELVDLVNTFVGSNSSLEVVFLVPAHYGDPDIENLIANLDLRWPVIRAESKVSQAWNHLVERHGEMSVNGTVLILREGRTEAVRGIREIRRTLTQLAGERQ